jgi:hypothetical protein
LRDEPSWLVGWFPWNVEIHLSPPAAKGLLLSRFSIDGRVVMLGTSLAREEYQLLCTHTFRIDIGEELKTNLIKIIQAEIGNFDPISFIGCNGDTYMTQ